MFWVVLIIIAGLLILIDIYKYFSKGIDSIGKNIGLSKKQTNSALNLWALFDSGKNRKK